MNATTIAAEIARRVPEMAKDSAANNADLIAGLIKNLTQDGDSNSFHGWVVQVGNNAVKDQDGSRYSGVVIACKWRDLQSVKCNMLYRTAKIVFDGDFQPPSGNWIYDAETDTYKRA